MSLGAWNIQLEAASERILIRKILPRENLVNECDWRALACVLRREETAANELDLHSLEIVGVDHVENAVWFLALCRWWLSFDDERREVCSFKRKSI